jgi:hypothetical protein
MEQAKDDMTKVLKPLIIKPADLKKELRRKRTLKDYRQALAIYLDSCFNGDIEVRRRFIAKILKVSLKTVKRYIYDEGENGDNSPTVF